MGRLSLVSVRRVDGTNKQVPERRRRPLVDRLRHPHCGAPSARVSTESAELH